QALQRTDERVLDAVLRVVRTAEQRERQPVRRVEVALGQFVEGRRIAPPGALDQPFVGDPLHHLTRHLRRPERYSVAFAESRIASAPAPDGRPGWTRDPRRGRLPHVARYRPRSSHWTVPRGHGGRAFAAGQEPIDAAASRTVRGEPVPDMDTRFVRSTVPLLTFALLAACGAAGEPDAAATRAADGHDAATDAQPAATGAVPFPSSPDEPRLTNLRMLTHGGENAEAYF